MSFFYRISDAANGDDQDKKITSEELNTSVVDETTKEEAPGLARDGKPLRLRPVALDKRVRMAKVDDVTKVVKQVEKDSATGVTTVEREMGRFRTDVSRQIERNCQDAKKRVARIKDAERRKKLEDKLNTACEKARTDFNKHMDDQDAAAKKEVGAAIGDFVKNVQDNVAKAKEQQTAALGKLTAIGSALVPKINSIYAPLSNVIEEINQK